MEKHGANERIASHDSKNQIHSPRRTLVSIFRNNNHPPPKPHPPPPHPQNKIRLNRKILRTPKSMESRSPDRRSHNPPVPIFPQRHGPPPPRRHQRRQRRTNFLVQPPHRRRNRHRSQNPRAPNPASRPPGHNHARLHHRPIQRRKQRIHNGPNAIVGAGRQRLENHSQPTQQSSPAPHNPPN